MIGVEREQVAQKSKRGGARPQPGVQGAQPAVQGAKSQK